MAPAAGAGPGAGVPPCAPPQSGCVLACVWCAAKQQFCFRTALLGLHRCAAALSAEHLPPFVSCPAGTVATVRVLHAKLAADLATVPILNPTPRTQVRALC